MNVFLAGLFAVYLPLIALYLFIVTTTATYLGLKYPRYFYSLLVINFFTILAACIVPTLSKNIDRLIWIIGVTLFLVGGQFIRGLVRNEGKILTAQSLRRLSLVSNAIFACFIQPEYADNIYLFERRLHVRKKHFMRSIARLRDISHSPKFKKQVEKIDELFDILMDCAQLRRRVSDHTVFALCANELKDISKEIARLLSDISRNNALDTFQLAEKIKLFEDNFQNVLRITAREPLAFFLFIASLKIFREKAALYG